MYDWTSHRSTVCDKSFLCCSVNRVEIILKTDPEYRESSQIPFCVTERRWYANLSPMSHCPWRCFMNFCITKIVLHEHWICVMVCIPYRQKFALELKIPFFTNGKFCFLLDFYKYFNDGPCSYNWNIQIQWCLIAWFLPSGLSKLL